MFYVYEWYIVNTNEVFYVGKGCRSRYKSTKSRNKLFLDYIKRYNCEVRIIKYFDNELDALDYEHKKICELKKINQCKCNLDNGGTGGVEFVWTQEMREYYSKFNIMKSKAQRERMSKNNPMKNREIAKRSNAAKRKHPIINGKYYETVEEASTDNNVSVCTIRVWCKQGYNTQNQKCHWSNEPEKDASYEPYTGRKIIYDGKIYDNIKVLAKAINRGKSTIMVWAKKGYSTDGKVCKYVDDTNEYVYTPPKHTCEKSIIINGVKYRSVIEAAKNLGLKDTALHYHLHKNTGRYVYEYDNQ